MKRHKRPQKPKRAVTHRSTVTVPNTIWRHTLGAEHRMEVMEDISRLAFADPDSMMCRIVKKVPEKFVSPIIIARPGDLLAPPESGLLGPNGQPIGG